MGSEMCIRDSFASIQPRYSIMDRAIEEEMIPLCSQYGVGILPYYPLANGFLTGKYKRSQEAPKGRLGRPKSTHEPRKTT